MKKIKNNYTNFILTVVAVLLFANLFKGEIIKPAHALDFHKHKAFEIYDLKNKVEEIVTDCRVSEGPFNNYEDGANIRNSWSIKC